MPAPVRVKTRVWFDLDGDKPKISVTRRPSAKEDVSRRTTPTSRKDPEYPRSALREGLQAYVYSRMDVDEAGKVVAVASEAYPREFNREQFARSNEQAFLRWAFPPGTRRTVCMEVVYRVRN
jgi:DNA-binding NarL/FixJ family response regulator